MAYRMLQSHIEQGKREGDAVIEVDLPSEDDLMVVAKMWLEKHLQPVSVRHFADEYINKAHSLAECIGNAVINDVIVGAMQELVNDEERLQQLAEDVKDKEDGE